MYCRGEIMCGDGDEVVTVTAVCEDDCDDVHDNIEYTAAKETGLVRVRTGD